MAPLSIDNVIRVWPGASTALALSGSGLFMPQSGAARKAFGTLRVRDSCLAVGYSLQEYGFLIE